MTLTDVSPAMNWTTHLSDRALGLRPSEIREFLKLLGNRGMISFAGGLPDPALFPRAVLADAAATILGDPALTARALQYGSSEGFAPLRAWIAAHMGRLGVPCEPDNIVITTGSQGGLDLLGKLFIDPGDTVLTASPTYLGALQAFDLYQPIYGTIDLDRQSVDSERSPTVVYLVPDFANPSGETLSLDARQWLLDRCAVLDVPVIEDAPYSALRFEGEPVPPLLALDIARVGSIEHSRVVYAGTFSKTITPGLRVGWLCAAQDLIQRVVLARQAADLHSSSLDQMLVHAVVDSGYEAQVATILPVYRQRRDAMLASLERSMPDGVTWTRPEGGMFVWLTLPEGFDSRELLRVAIERERIVFVPGTPFFRDGSGARHLRLSYTGSDEATIADGIGRLGGLVAEHLERLPVMEMAGVR